MPGSYTMPIIVRDGDWEEEWDVTAFGARVTGLVYIPARGGSGIGVFDCVGRDNAKPIFALTSFQPMRTPKAH